ncbi:branched-chain amino acid ABC transporter substrate-binding protein [Afipia massiliensis]|uniref:Branched-chain amino acid ABC transporter substrate-binding protein n=1 Tax=Afipia massiliensis TaxID=211460 RepID=A0A4U6BLH3_9BRAD|nr:ABC transporter substrate-binding protein [Afipia massiliensis]TKT70275.1 branched-chain amino acid ABC transporter substrate-binding protein [Afipia massiliensis]
MERRTYAFGAIVAAMMTLTCASNVSAQKAYDTGASDTEIKIGNISPYSGPASSYATIAKAQAAYFQMLNDNGGINGRKINYISYDDAYSPPKTVEQARKLVESDEVLFLLSPLGTPGNSAIHKYLNARKIPHLFLTSGANKWDDPKNFPWTMGFLNNYQAEADIYIQYLQKNFPNAKIGIIYQNDDFGKDYLAGFRQSLGAAADKQIVAAIPYESSSPTIEPLIVSLKAANPDVVFYIATPKFVAQAIKKVGELGWKPIQIIPNTATSIVNVLIPAGVENSTGVLGASYLKDVNDQQWSKDPAVVKWHAFMDKYMPGANKADSLNMYAYVVAQVAAQTIKQSSDNLTRENIMKQAANLEMEPEGLLPGVKIKTSSIDFAPLEQLQMMKFTGAHWELFGDLLTARKR